MLRSFGGKSICTTCYQATIELARAAIRAMPSNEKDRQCRNCRALHNPSLGSAWCSVTELGDDRARICANFVAQHAEVSRTEVSGGRAAVLDVWEAAVTELRATLGDSNYATWFDAVEPVAIEVDSLVLAVPDEYTRDWLERRLDTVVQRALEATGHGNLIPAYRVERSVTLLRDEQFEPRGCSDEGVKASFNPHYSFAEFIVGSGNRLAHASALACVDKPGQTYNPLVLYGGVGVGKTHLLQAIGQEAIDQRRGTVLYSTSEAFTNDLICAIREGATVSFRERYRNVDFLLLDDIQFIAGKEATQEEFFHTFNALHQAGKQIVMTSDRPPSELRVLEDRLRSRFAWGLTADIQPPDLETRIAIVRAKAALRYRCLSETALGALAMHAGNNVRELEGALHRVLARADLLGMEPGLEVVRSVLGDGEERSRCGAGDILQAVAAYFRVKTSDLAGPHRERSISYPRRMAMYLLREEAKLSLVEIGNHLGGRNHSTVIYGCDKVAVEMKRKGHVKQDAQAIRQLMYGVS
ncbi:MAG: chromosomal replication initiator protein DnaA [Chloroflexi bacterium]|nr:MAG: chromosomal replication initiator protein DnaA [Chloroflexota bacterium]